MGQLCDRCRRSASEAASLSAPAKPVPHGVVAAADQARAASQQSDASKPSVVASSTSFESGVQELRKRGVRPKMPRYNETPLLTIGKQVRILKEAGFRNAMIECVNDSDGTVDVAYEDGDQEDETVPTDMVRPLQGYEQFDTAPGKKEKSTEEKRQLGIRANAPAYNDTPLLSVGKQVRICPKVGRIRRAEIECVDETARTVDVRYRPAAEAWPGVSVVAKKKEKEEETVPMSAVKPLEEVEFRKEIVWKKQFQDDLYGAISSLKDGADDLFMEVKDCDAALEFYSIAIDKLKEIPHSELMRYQVLAHRGDNFDLGAVSVVDIQTQKAFVSFPEAEGPEAKPVGVLLKSLTPIHQNNLLLQGSLYANRARIWAQLERLPEAVKDLSVVIALQRISEKGEAWKDCLVKARILRGKINLMQDQTQAAKKDVSAALSLNPEKAVSDIVWEFYRDMEKEIKEKSIKQDLSKFASRLPMD